jgi:hypothetical protein
MVNYLTLVLCMLSAFIAGGLTSVTWAIFREKDMIEQIKTRINTQGATSGRMSSTHSNVIGPPRTGVNTLSGACPVDNCRIKAPHSHTDALIRRVKER